MPCKIMVNIFFFQETIFTDLVVIIVWKLQVTEKRTTGVLCSEKGRCHSAHFQVTKLRHGIVVMAQSELRAGLEIEPRSPDSTAHGH